MLWILVPCALFCGFLSWCEKQKGEGASPEKEKGEGA